MTSRLARVVPIFVVLFLAGTKVSVGDDNARTPISREAILGALHNSGIRIVPDQMEQLSGVTAAEPNPLLKVLSVDVMDGESDKVLLRCEHPNTCLPFYVLVHWGPGGGAGDRPRWKNGSPAEPGLRAESMLVRSGRVVVLMLEGNYVHMRLPVLCLQSGRRGQRVRVISRDTKRRYLARVTGPGVVTSLLSE